MRIPNLVFAATGMAVFTVAAPCASSSASASASASVSASVSAAAAPASTSSTKTTAASKMKFFGVNESGPEFGNTNLPGVKGTDYVWPDMSTISTLMSKGMNTFRINIMMERLIPNTMTGSLDSAYLADLKTTVSGITSKGAYAMICPHNYGRYYNNIITDTAGFEAWWKTVAAQFASNSLVIFDTNNEYHDMSQSLVVQLNQAAINGVRAAGATSQYITVEGNAYTGAWSWTTLDNGGGTNGATMGSLTDPQNKIIYQMHQYLDSDDSGTSATCVSSTIGAERIADATQWLKANGKVGMLGEFAGGANDQCKSAVNGMLQAMDAASDVWLGALWWAAGPWWADYIFSMEPTSGTAYSYYLDDIMQYA